MNTDELKELLAAKYCPPAYALLWEVADSTGAGQGGYADAVAMSLYPSAGLELHGFELKVSRSDLARELANPAKCERLAQRVTRWWLVLGEGVAYDPAEIPTPWGIQVAKDGKLAIKRHSAQLHPGPVSISRPFLGALLRRADGGSRVLTAYEKGRREGQELGYKQGLDAAGEGAHKRKYELLKAQWDEIDEHLGGRLLHSYLREPQIAERLLLAESLETLRRRAESARWSLSDALADLQQVLAPGLEPAE